MFCLIFLPRRLPRRREVPILMNRIDPALLPAASLACARATWR